MINVSSHFQSDLDAGRTMVRIKMGERYLERKDLLGDIKVVEKLIADSDSFSIGNATASTVNFEIFNENGRYSNLPWGETHIFGYANNGTWTTVPYPTGKDALSKSDFASSSGYVYGKGSEISDASGTIYSATSATNIKFLYILGARVFALGSNDVVSFGYFGDGTWGGSNVSWSELGNTTWANSAQPKELVANYTLYDYPLRLKRWSEEDGVSGGKLRGRYESGSTIIDFSFNDTSAGYRTWEEAPIGIFDVDKPERTAGNSIECQGYGLMARFDNIEMERYDNLFPISERDLMARVCADASIGSYTTAQNVTLTENYWAGYSARDFIKHCAELDGKNAVVNRYGNLVFKAPSSSGVSMNENRCFNVSIAEFATTPITGVAVKNSDNDVGVNVGAVTEVLTVLENPIIGSQPSSAQTSIATSILGIVDDVTAYHPLTADALYGWQLEAGDIVTIVNKSVSFSIPIFEIEYTITNTCKVVITAVGVEHRNDMMESNREQYVANHKRYELSKTVDGLLSAVFDEQGDSRIVQNAQLISAEVTRAQTVEGTKLNTSGGSASSFGWELTASSWSLKSNGTEVLKVDSSGLHVNGSGEFTGTIHATAGSFSGEVTCTKLTVGGQDYSVSALQQIFSGGNTAYNYSGNWNSAYNSTTSGGYCYDGANYAYSNGSYWNGGGGFGSNCWGSGYNARCVDARYLRMYSSGGGTFICTMNPVTIGTKTYWIPCVPPD